METTTSSSALAMAFMADYDLDNSGVNNNDLLIGEDGNDSRSGTGGSDHTNFGNVDDLEDRNNVLSGRNPKRKKYHRHTPQQTQELENFFKDCQHPDEKQRLELGRRMGLECRQVKFWFQNRRTQYKTQLERQENGLLKQEFDRLRLENMSIKDFMTNPLCKTCGGPPAAITTTNNDFFVAEEHRLRMENSRLKDELIRVCGLAEKLIGKPISDLMAFLPSQPNCSHQMNHSFLGGSISNGVGLVGNVAVTEIPLENVSHNLTGGVQFGKMRYVQLAETAMDELVAMAQNGTTLWHNSNNHDGQQTLNFNEYTTKFSTASNYKTPGFVTDARKEVSSVNITSLELVSSMMNSARWNEMFSCMVSKASTLELLCSGVNGTHDGELLLMSAEFFFPSPLVPTRHTKFIRYCKQHSETTWAVVDVSIDNPSSFGGNDEEDSSKSYRRLPSGFIIQDVANGYSLVTWIEHTEYDDRTIHHLFRPFVQSGYAFGPKRHLAALHRHLNYINLHTSAPHESSTGLTLNGRRNILNLSRRLVADFFSGVYNSSNWENLRFGTDIQVLTRVCVNEPGVPSGVIMSVSKSVYVPVERTQMFDFVRDERVRGQWDLLSSESSMQELIKICKGGEDSVNRISLLCPPGSGNGGNGMESSSNNKVVLQETWTDPTNSLVVYTPINVERIRGVIDGGDPSYVEILPSGFVINDGSFSGDGCGSLLTVGFQILVSNCPTAKLNVESVETMGNLVGCTIQKIKIALGCE